MSSPFYKIAAIFLILAWLVACSNKPEKSKNTSAPKDKIAKILDAYIPKLEQSTSKDTIFRPFGPINERDTVQHLAIGRFVDGKTPYAVYFTFKDSLISFYRFEQNAWHTIGNEKMQADNIGQIHFEDLDADGKNEIVIETYPNMNGNTGVSMYYVSQKIPHVHLAGFLFGRYKTAPDQKLHYIYEGSYYSDYSR